MDTPTTQPAPKRRKSMRHTIQGARSMVRSVTKRLAADSEEADWELPELAELAQLVAEAETALRQGVATARSHGLSWAVIGDEMGMTKQGAQQRFGRYC